MKKRLIVLSGLGLVGIPFLTFAQNQNLCVYQTGIQAIICKIGEILNTIIPILIGDDEEAKKKGRNRVIYGIIGLVVIVGMWGLVRIVTSTFNLDNNPGNITTPCVPGTPGC